MCTKEQSFREFSKRLTLLRKQNGLTQKEMTKILEISVSTLSKIEKGELPPRLSVEILFQIHDHFGIPPHKQLEKT